MGSLQLFREAWVCSLHLLEEEAEQRQLSGMFLVGIVLLGVFKSQCLSRIEHMILKSNEQMMKQEQK